MSKDIMDGKDGTVHDMKDIIDDVVGTVADVESQKVSFPISVYFRSSAASSKFGHTVTEELHTALIIKYHNLCQKLKHEVKDLWHI